VLLKGISDIDVKEKNGLAEVVAKEKPNSAHWYVPKLDCPTCQSPLFH
jgi:hypothetical protein